MVLVLGTAIIFSLIGSSTHSYALAYEKKVAQRDGKFSIFNIIKFQNGPCIGSSKTRNGTCFTAAECENNGGKKDGECADGFGVCCVTMLTNGQTTTLNQSYIVSSSTSSGRRKRQATGIPTGAQMFTICPSATNICRIRFDFTTFTLAGPMTGVGTSSTAVAPSPATARIDNSLGHCVQDQFSIMSSGGTSSPVICGVNTGQHMIVDNDGSGCTTANFAISGTFATRGWDIKVMQFMCGEEIAGPQGCLQFFTGAGATAGIQIRSFNFPAQTDGTTVAAGVVHLASQKYSICIRREAGKTTMCYVPCTQTGNAIGQQSFGLSVSTAANTANVDSRCTSDYITIPQGVTSAIAAINVIGTVSFTGVQKFCGRGLNTGAVSDSTLVSVCTTQVPFTVGVSFDDDEVLTSGSGTFATNEKDTFPGGIVGFCLRARQS